jgi:hypothetical protein
MKLRPLQCIISPRVIRMMNLRSHHDYPGACIIPQSWAASRLGDEDPVGERVHGVSILRFPKMERLRVVPSPLLAN